MNEAKFFADLPPMSNFMPNVYDIKQQVLLCPTLHRQIPLGCFRKGRQRVPKLCRAAERQDAELKMGL